MRDQKVLLRAPDRAYDENLSYSPQPPSNQSLIICLLGVLEGSSN